MSAPQAGRYDSVARRWLALAERRQEDFVELCRSGRWTRYYAAAELESEIDKMERARDGWAALLGLPPQQAGSLTSAVRAIFRSKLKSQA